MFISKQVEALYYQYKDNPFGNKKDRRIESWLEILSRLPSTLNEEVELINGVNIDFDLPIFLLEITLLIYFYLKHLLKQLKFGC